MEAIKSRESKLENANLGIHAIDHYLVFILLVDLLAKTTSRNTYPAAE